VKIIRQIKR